MIKKNDFIENVKHENNRLDKNDKMMRIFYKSSNLLHPVSNYGLLKMFIESVINDIICSHYNPGTFCKMMNNL